MHLTDGAASGKLNCPYLFFKRICNLFWDQEQTNQDPNGIKYKYL